MDADENDEDVEFHPPTAERVLQRALALSAVVVRGFLESDAGSAAAEEFRARMLSWLEDHGVSLELEPDEAAFLHAPLGTAPAQSAANATWRAEGLAVLAWSLGRLELPPHDRVVDPKAATDAVGFLSGTNLGPVELRSSAELHRMVERCFAVHWRVREFSLRKTAIDFEETARTCWFGPLNIAGVQLVSNDLAIGGRSLASANADAVRSCMSSAQERHHAANWLIGQSAIYSDVDAST